MRLKDKVAIITGGNGVLGGAIAMGLAAQGVKIAILGRTAHKVETRVAQIEQSAGQSIALIADVLDQESLERANRSEERRVGKEGRAERWPCRYENRAQREGRSR